MPRAFDAKEKSNWVICIGRDVNSPKVSQLPLDRYALLNRPAPFSPWKSPLENTSK